MDGHDVQLHVAHYLDVLHQGDVDLLGDVQGLEQYVVFLALVDKAIDMLWLKDLLVDTHKGFDVFETDVVF